MNWAEQGPTRREVLRAIGMMAGTAVLYQAMEVLGHAKETQFAGPPNLQGARPGTKVVVLGAGLAGMLANLQARGVTPRQRTVPSIGLHQLFLDDPNGVVVELNYPASEKQALNAAA